MTDVTVRFFCPFNHELENPRPGSWLLSDRGVTAEVIVDSYAPPKPRLFIRVNVNDGSCEECQRAS